MPLTLHTIMPQLTNGTAAAPMAPLFWIISDRMVGKPDVRGPDRQQRAKPEQQSHDCVAAMLGREKLQRNETHEVAIAVRRPGATAWRRSRTTSNRSGSIMRRRITPIRMAGTTATKNTMRQR